MSRPARYSMLPDAPLVEGGFEWRRAVRNPDGLPVVVKRALETSAGTEDALRHEAELTAGLPPRYVVAPLGLEALGGASALVLDAYDASPLRPGAPMDLDRFLPLALGMTRALAAVHAAGVVHRDIQPCRFWTSPDGHVRLAGFAIATRVPSAHTVTAIGSLPYMAPEQTGRINRPIDARSDLYGLGATFYELLAGRRPFDAQDATEWCHCHIARTPAPPPAPQPLANLVMKLLAKAAEDRYQTARGVERDLARCLACWEAEGRLEPFPLAAADIADRIVPPRKLYGREREVAALRERYARVVTQGRAELALVVGGPGVGKTALVRELEEPVLAGHGYFAAGKTDQARDSPYVALAQALDDLVRGILAEPQGRLDAWTRALHEALGPNARLILQLVPVLERLLGDAPPPPEVPPGEAEARLNETVRRLVSVFARREHPLVLFLDDLQWADGATLRLLEHLVTDPAAGPLLLVGACRDAGIAATHPLAQMLERAEAAGARAFRLALGALPVEQVGRLLADVLGRSPRDVEALARLVHEKTAGNPFFVLRFLTALHDDGLLALDPAVGWRWDLGRIRERGYTDNVAELMIDQLRRLPEGARDAIGVASLLGAAPDVPTLAIVQECTEADVHAALRDAARGGLVSLQGERYRFAHDRVQEAATLLVPAHARGATHLRIGRLLLERLSPEAREARLFEIVEHLRRGAEGLTDAEERQEAAGVALAAARKAIASAAFDTAAAWLADGIVWMGPAGWTARFAETFALHLQLARCRLAAADLEGVEALLATLGRAARGVTDLAAVARLRMEVQLLRGEHAAATQTALATCADLFGIQIGAHPSRAEVHDAIDRMWREAGRPPEALADAAAMRDPVALAAADVLATALPASYLAGEKNLHDLIACRLVEITLQAGVAATSPMGLAILAHVSLLRRRPDEAHRMIRVAEALLERPGIAQAKVRLVVGIFVAFVLRPPAEVIAGFEATREAAAREGDTEFGFYSRLNICMSRLQSGAPLAQVAAETGRAISEWRRLRYRHGDEMLGEIARVVDILRGRAAVTPPSGIPGFGEALARLYALEARLVLGDAAGAASVALDSRDALAVSEGQPPHAEYEFFAALALCAHHDGASEDERRRALAFVREALPLMRDRAEFGAATWRGPYLLVSAELARIDGRVSEATRLFEDAIQAARAAGLVQIEALASERAAAFHAGRDCPTMADGYLRHARRCYHRWGATAKVAQLDDAHPEWAAPDPGGGLGVGTVDVEALVRALDTISTTLELEPLLGALLRIALQNAGAQRGCLVLEREDGPCVEATATIDGVVVGPAVPLDAYGEAALSVVRYVRRTGEDVVLDDARFSNFAADPYVARSRPRSVLCVGVHREARHVAVLYLENDLTTHAFPRTRVTLVRLLAAQAAIALENAMLSAQHRLGRKQLQDILDHTTAVVYIKDAAGRYVQVNRRFEELFHVLNRHLVGRTDADLFPESMAADFRANDVRVLETDAPLELEETVPHPDGTLHTYLALKFPLRSPEGTVYAVCGISTDITDRKRAEDQVRRLNEDLEERIAERTADLEAFAYSVSHDLRAPLREMTEVVRLVEAGCGDRLDPLGQKGLARIRERASRMAALVDDLLRLAQASRAPLRLAPTDLGEVARRLVAALREAEPERRVDVVVADGLVARCDPDLVALALGNLLANAWKFTGRRTGATVEVGETERCGERVFFVRDDGAGFDMAYASRLFQPLQRLHTQDDFPGTGIGLTIVHRVVRRHGGRVWAEGAVGRGATFFFTLPEPPAEGGAPGSS